MKRIAQILSLSLAIFTFFGSVGVGVFTHFCHEDGVEQSFLIPRTSCCEEKREKLDSCCAHDEEVFEEDCCSEEIDFFQVDFDQYESYEAFTFLPFDFTEVKTFSPFPKLASSEVYISNYANPPPLRAARQILIQHQVFRI